MGVHNKNERRSTPRIQALLKIEYDSIDDVASDYLTDLSEGGLFIQTHIPLEIGSTIEFTISFPGLLKPLALRGMVRRRIAQDEGPNPGIGVSFCFDDEEESEQIRWLVDRLAGKRDEEGDESRRFRVLLVDDNPVILNLFSHALKRMEQEMSDSPLMLEICSTTNGAEAWKHLQEQPFQLAIIDYHLPEMPGIDLLRQMRAHKDMRDIPVVVISANEENVKLTALQNGANLFVPKPVQARALISTLTALLYSCGALNG